MPGRAGAPAGARAGGGGNRVRETRLGQPAPARTGVGAVANPDPIPRSALTRSDRAAFPKAGRPAGSGLGGRIRQQGGRRWIRRPGRRETMQVVRPRPPEPRRRSPCHTHSDLWVTASVDGAGCARPEPHGPRRGRRPRTLDRSVGCRTGPPSEHSEQARAPPDWFQREKRQTQKEGSGRGRRSETVSVV